MAIAFARAFVQVLPDMRTFGREVEAGVKKSGTDKVAKKHGGIFGGTFGKAAAVTMAAGIAAPIVIGGLKKVIGDARALGLAQLQQQVKNVGGNWVTFSKQLDVADKSMLGLGFDSAQTHAGLTRLVTTTGSTTVSLHAMTQAANLARFKHIDLATASNLLAKASVGSTRALKDVGISTNDLPKNFSKTGTAASRMQIVLGLLQKKIGGDAVVASKTFGGRLDILKAQLTDASAKIGVALLPMLSQLASIAIKYLVPALIQFGKAITAALPSIGQLFKALLPIVSYLLVNMLAGVTAIIKGFMALPGPAKIAIAAIIGVGLALAALSANPIIAIVGAVILLTGIIVKNWGTISKFLKKIWTDVSAAFGIFVNTVKLGFLTLLIAGLSFIDKIVGAFALLPGPLGAPFRKAKAAIDKTLAGMEQSAANAVSQIQSDFNKLHGKTVPLLVAGSGTWKALGAAGQLAGGSFTGGATKHPGFATGGKVPGTGNQDDRLILATPGEAVVPKRLVPSLAPWLAAHGVPGFATGGIIPKYSGKVPGLGPWMNHNVAVTEALEIGAIGRELARQWVKVLGSFGGSAILQFARQFAGRVPYVWGGTTPSGWDCSGFTSYAYHHFGIPAPRTSQEQQRWARPSGNVPGALVFFYGRGGTASHVGLATGGPLYLGADSPALGTTYQPVAGNTGFGVPPLGLTGWWSGKGGSVVELGRAMAAGYGWTGLQWSDLYQLWQRESNWNPYARNPTSGAAGIPQDITGNFHGGARGQIAWGLAYIAGRYGNPARAWGHELQVGWYGNGGTINEPVIGVGRSGRMYGFGEQGSETVVPGRFTTKGVERRLDRLIAVMEANAAQTAAGVADALDGATAGAAYSARFSVG